MLDRYDCSLEYKGGEVEFCATKIIITSPSHPSQWYEGLANSEGDLDQLTRRITKIVHCVSPSELGFK